MFLLGYIFDCGGWLWIYFGCRWVKVDLYWLVVGGDGYILLGSEW